METRPEDLLEEARERAAERSPGLMAALRRLGATSLALTHNRLQLAAVELQEEKNRLVGALILGMAVLALGVLALGVLAAAIVLAAPEGSRALVAAILGLLFLVGAGSCLLLLRRRLTKGPSPFSETIAQFKQDAECLRTLK